VETAFPPPRDRIRHDLFVQFDEEEEEEAQEDELAAIERRRLHPRAGPRQPVFPITTTTTNPTTTTTTTTNNNPFAASSSHNALKTSVTQRIEDDQSFWLWAAAD
jgi:hypothetical protein